MDCPKCNKYLNRIKVDGGTVYKCNECNATYGLTLVLLTDDTVM